MCSDPLKDLLPKVALILLNLLVHHAKLWFDGVNDQPLKTEGHKTWIFYIRAIDYVYRTLPYVLSAALAATVTYRSPECFHNQVSNDIDL